MTSRDRILGRVRSALRDVREPDPYLDVPDTWVYGQPTPTPEVIAHFAARVADYEATVVRCAEADIGAEVARALAETGATSVVLPGGLDPAWDEELDLDVRTDDPALSAPELNGIDAVVTAAAVGVAETGTIVLDHGPTQGRRALSLVPDRHVCIVRSEQVVSDVPEAVARLRPALEAGAALTWISGPSATSDIELNRVEGVHGPRTLWVILAD
jgi:L-lactate dehydrogenase complex protein LldG